MSQDQAALQGADQSSMNPSADGFPDPMTLIQGAAFLGIGNNTMQRLARTGAIKTEQIKDCLGRTCKGVRQAGLLDLKPCLDTAELLRQSGDALKVEPGSNLLALEKVAGWTPAMTDAATHSPDFTEVN